MGNAAKIIEPKRDASPKIEPDWAAYRLRQQSLLIDFGRRALETSDFERLFDEAVRLTAEGMRAAFCKLLEYLPDEHRLLVRAGIGWRLGVVGQERMAVDAESPAGFAFLTGRPVLSNHLENEQRFRTPRLLAEHGVKRATNVLVTLAGGRAWGVLAADSPDEGQFDEADVDFMRGMAQTLGAAIQRLRNEDALRASEARFRAVTDAIPGLIVEADPVGHITYVNAGFARFSGVPREALLGDGWRSVMHPGDRERIVAAWNEAVQRGTFFEEEYRLCSGDRTARWFLARAAPVRDPSGAVEKWIGVLTDIDEAKQGEAELRASEEQFRTMADSLPQLAWMADAGGWIYWYNQRWYEYTGTSFDEMEGWGWRSVHHPEHVERVVERIKQAWESGEPWEDTFPLRRADGEYRWFLSRAVPIRDAEGKVIRWFGTNTDITERRKLEELQQLLVKEVSHRVKNSLALVSALLQLQSRNLPDSSRAPLEDAASRVQTVAAVHDQLFRQADAREVDLKPFLSNLGAAIAETAPEHETIVEVEPATVSADMAVPIGLLVNELVTNAYKHAYPEGADGGVFVNGEAVAEGRYRLRVCDGGRGLPADFDMERRSSSLGMRVITSLAKQLGGEITASSNEPGACFELTFSLRQPSPLRN